jgi:hypothetical protein
VPWNWCQGMNSASLCSLAGRYDNPIPPRFLAPIDFLKIPALNTFSPHPRPNLILIAVPEAGSPSLSAMNTSYKGLPGTTDYHPFSSMLKRKILRRYIFKKRLGDSWYLYFLSSCQKWTLSSYLTVFHWAYTVKKSIVFPVPSRRDVTNQSLPSREN